MKRVSFKTGTKAYWLVVPKKAARERGYGTLCFETRKAAEMWIRTAAGLGPKAWRLLAATSYAEYRP